MFKLLKKDDKNVVSNNMFIKNAGYFQDAFAFFEAYSKLCEKSIEDIPNYCLLSDGNLCLEGVCLFIKTYASEFSFKTIDLSIDYLKILYYSISAFSQDGEFVSRDMLVNDYLVFKEANKKYNSVAEKKLDNSKQKFNKLSGTFDKKNSSYAKYFIWSRVTDILSTVLIILSFLLAMVPVAFYYAERIALKSAVIYAAATLVIGLILRFELKLISKHLSEQAMELAYFLQTLKKEKDESFNLLSKVTSETEKIFVENYEFQKSFENLIESFDLGFDEILALARNNNQKLQGKEDVLAIDKSNQEYIYEIVGKIAAATPKEIGRLENIYGEILSQDFLKYNNYVRFSFLNKFIDNAFVTKNWQLNLGGTKINPFGIDAKAIAQEKLSYRVKEDNEIINMRLDKFINSKYSKKLKYLRIKNIKDETSFESVKYGYISNFYEANDNVSFSDKTFNRRIPKLIEIKLALLQTRLICNTLGETDYLKTSKTVLEYENTNLEVKFSDTKNHMIEEKSKQNQKYLKSLFECDEIKYLGDDEVLCVVGTKSFKGFRLSNI